MFEHYLQLKDARVVQTPAFLVALENMRGVLVRRAITVLWGPSGYGKTVAGRAIYGQLLESQRCWIPLTTRPNPRVITNELLHALTGVEHDETRWQSARTLKREMRHRDHVAIFIDEAQNLSLECIEFLRWLHEAYPGRIALALIGGVQLHSRLSRSPQLMRRIYQPSRFQRLDGNRIDEYLRTFHPIYEAADRKLITAIDDRHCEGNFGYWARLTASAYDVCRELGVATITSQIADLAIRRHSSWSQHS
jgi:type II secretory pathway predicted ATPase ExeA